MNAEAPTARTPLAYLKDALRHDDVVRLADAARILTTAHPGGHLVWREWGCGPTVLLLHGGFGSWLHWVRNIAPLARQFRVLAADLPGLGDSDPLPGQSPGAGEVAAALARGMRQLLAPDEPLRLVGFSLGAVVGAHLAHAMRESLGQAILIGPSALGEWWRNITTGLVRRRPDMTEAERRKVVRANLLGSMIADPAAVDDLAIDLQADLTSQKRRLRGLHISASDAMLRVIPRLVPRLTIVWGQRDVYARPSVAAVAEFLRASHPGLRTQIVPHAGHWLAYEASREVNAMLLDILSPEKGARSWSE